MKAYWLVALFFALIFVRCATGPKSEELKLQAEAQRQAEEQAKKAALEEEIKMTLSTGLEYYKNGQYEDAIRNFKRVIFELDPNRETAYKYLADAYFRINAPDSAEWIYSEALKKFPARSYLHRGLGFVYLKEGKDSLAKIELMRAVELDTTDHVSYEALASMQLSEGKIDSAILWSEKAVCYDSLNISLWTTLGKCYETRKNNLALVRVYKELRRLKPDSIEVLVSLGKAYLELDSVGAAESVLKEYMAAKPDDYQGPYFLGLAYLLGKDYQASITYLKKAQKMNPTFAKIDCELGMAYRELKDYKKAMDYADSALKKRKNYGYAYLLRGSVYEAWGFDKVKPDGTLTYEAKLEFEKAVEEYKKALQDPEWASQAQEKINYLKDYLPTAEEKKVKKFLEEGKQKE